MRHLQGKQKANFIIRRATLEDKNMVLNWRNDKLSRAMSEHKLKIDHKTHNNWFAKQLKSKKNQIYIGSLDFLKDFGLVRFKEVSHTTSNVSINLNSSYRGLGLSAALLDRAIKHYMQETSILRLQAIINSNNAISIKIFTSLGFVKIKPHDNQDFDLYELEKSKL